MSEPSPVRQDDFVISDLEALTEIIGEPPPEVRSKVVDRIDRHARTLISLSPLAFLATATESGLCDVSPRGDPPGSILVLDDHTLVLAERPGNQLAFSLRNIVVNPRVGLLFVVPGVDVTLRVNGSARLVTTPALLDSLAIGGKRPRLAVLVHVERLYLHCARAFNRASLWHPQRWPDTTSLPSAGTILRDQTGSTASAAEIDSELEAVNRHLY
ncbi:MSMEG_1061 family FMN-dependent PPOX-type flavoprotein [Lentzea jiangxiensis]|uniref:Pyridoxamine 5'-phosphate oxidase N-terminal domain-containing protein n=1 Tax=Lentzea jiangxiensis TaxID=641025 RepID=A0A1H0LZC0_9PSEU|nr:MSMEG_1061 family FMN-dependent PPOX-type flavoprotein [Lentzea jiangxiensis]SDO73485.1 hypothetical protein SAMN05421507_103516 [Lentzea jiangxiensis]